MKSEMQILRFYLGQQARVAAVLLVFVALVVLLALVVFWTLVFFWTHVVVFMVFIFLAHVFCIFFLSVLAVTVSFFLSQRGLPSKLWYRDFSGTSLVLMHLGFGKSLVN